jgi:hypothetical protein
VAFTILGGVPEIEPDVSKFAMGAEPSLKYALSIPLGSWGFVQLISKSGVFCHKLGFAPAAVIPIGAAGAIISIETRDGINPVILL